MPSQKKARRRNEHDRCSHRPALSGPQSSTNSYYVKTSFGRLSFFAAVVVASICSCCQPDLATSIMGGFRDPLPKYMECSDPGSAKTVLYCTVLCVDVCPAVASDE